MDGESNATFPAADAEGSLDPSRGNDFQVDPLSAEVADLKEQAEVSEIKKVEEKCTCDGLKTLKRVVVISAVAVAVAGAAMVIARKLKEK